MHIPRNTKHTTTTFICFFISCFLTPPPLHCLSAALVSLLSLRSALTALLVRYFVTRDCTVIGMCTHAVLWDGKCESEKTALPYSLEIMNAHFSQNNLLKVGGCVYYVG